MITNEYVTCSVCGHRYKGKIPKGGDGSILIPRLHIIKIPVTNNMGITILPPKKEICSGSYAIAKEYQNGY